MPIKCLFILFLLHTSMWAGYGYFGTLRFPAATVSGTYTNITLVFNANDSKLATTVNGGVIQNTTVRTGVTVPTDFSLTSDTTCNTITGYSWGIESYSQTTGKIIGWVNIPILTNTSNLSITVCAGNVAITTYQGGTAGTEFDSFTKGIWHVPDGTTLNYSDFSSNSTTTTNTNTTASTGQIGGAALFNGLTSFLGTGVTSTLQPTTSITVSAWVNPISVSATARIVDSTNTPTFTGYGLSPNSTGLPRMIVGDGSTLHIATSSSAIPINTWSYIIGTWDGTTVSIYINGVLKGTTTSSSISYLNVTGFQIGAALGGTVPFNGSIDEIKIASTSRTTGWLIAEYNNQSNPPTLSPLCVVGANCPTTSNVFTF